MVARGQKRRLVEEADAQLQSVLEISMQKFLRDQALVQPSLLRSVLINNTLRQVQSEVESLSAVNTQTQTASRSAVNTHTNSHTASRSAVNTHTNSHTASRSAVNTHTNSHTYRIQPDFPRASGQNSALFSLNAENLEEDFMAWTSEEDFSLSSVISSILKDLDSVIDAGHGPCVSPLSSVENLTGDFRFPPSSLRNETPSDMPSSLRTEAVCPVSPQDVTLDKLLLDIDTSLFDPEVNLLQGFSVTADDLVKYLPSRSKSPSAPSSSSLVSHGQATWEIQEIERVMDILMRTYPQS